MHEDYKTRLTALCDKLTDVAITESNPDNWPGAGKAQKDFTQEERGDRYWEKKNAAATLTLLVKLHSLIGMHARGGAPADPASNAEAEANKQIAKAEKEAQRIVDRALSKAKVG
ncbi:hypothetical protein PTR49_05650 [Serratia ureilytica]|uniref:hypothetical protein n=1 Tax=Serratia TaxID=613 RepID=UPI00313DCD65